MTIHNAFDEVEIRRIAERGGSTESASGNSYGIGRVMRILELAVRNGPEVDASYLEGLMAAEILRDLGAFSPEDAVSMEDIGFRRILGANRRSRRPAEQVVCTEDGRVYLERAPGSLRAGRS